MLVGEPMRREFDLGGKVFPKELPMRPRAGGVGRVNLVEGRGNCSPDRGNSMPRSPEMAGTWRRGETERELWA